MVRCALFQPLHFREIYIFSMLGTETHFTFLNFLIGPMLDEFQERWLIIVPESPSDSIAVEVIDILLV